LKNLSAAKQAAIMEYIQGEKRHSLVATSKWLKRQRIEATPAMLSQYRRWYLLQEKLKSSEEFALETTAEYKKRGWIKTLREERAVAQAIFNRIVLEEGDPKLWTMVERVNLLKDKVELDLRKYEDQKAETKKVVKKRKLSPDERQRRIRQILGTE
jgi:hypothetical protein